MECGDSVTIAENIHSYQLKLNQLDHSVPRESIHSPKFRLTTAATHLVLSRLYLQVYCSYMWANYIVRMFQLHFSRLYTNRFPVN